MRRRELLFAGGHVVQRAVRFHVLQFDAGGSRESDQRADLIHDQVVGVIGVTSMFRRPNPIRSGNPGCAPTATPCFTRFRDRRTHHRRITAMETARDVGRRDEGKDLVVGADAVGAEALAHVAVEIDPVRHLDPREKRSVMPPLACCRSRFASRYSRLRLVDRDETKTQVGRRA